MWKNGEVDIEIIQNTLIIYLGVMFGVAGASAGVRLLSSQLAKVALKKIPQKALTKTIWYPIVKQVCKAIGIKMTKDVAAKGISKAIPVIGGLVSGGLTFISMRPMGKKLASTLDEANFHYTETKMKKDLDEFEKLSKSDDVEVVEFEEIEIAPEFKDYEIEEETSNVAKNVEKDVFAKIEKLSKLRDMGALTEEEFTAKKTELLKMI